MTFPVVGMIGAGQLARMTYAAAVPLGVPMRILASAPDDAAARIASDIVVGDYRDLATLRRFAAGCDVVSFDHEHVPTHALQALQEAGVNVRPGPAALVHAQDKAVMRDRLTALGVACPRWRVVTSGAEVAELAAETGWPVVLKATRGGYDGRGVWLVRDVVEAQRVLSEASERGARLLAEERVAFRRELAALVARSPHGQAVAYPVVETVQVEGICREVLAPAPVDATVAVQAQRVALQVAAALEVTGVMAVELFDIGKGNGDGVGVLVNELAMRPHNSGHWTIEGAGTSQFEQHLRAVLDLPLGDPRPRAPYAVMANVLGGDHPDLYPAYRHVMARDPGVHVHLYGKDVKPGRKVGHVTVLGTDLDELRERARHAAGYLRGGIDE